MSRRIASRLKIEGSLTALGPLHIGGMGGDEDVDLMLARDGQNRVYIPGTSLAGPLRAWLSERADSQVANDLFGPLQKKGDKEGQASIVMVEDGLVTLPADCQFETRDGIGIDRQTGTAADGAKYDRAILPYGSTVVFKMSVELPGKVTDQKRSEIRGLIGAMIEALGEGQIRFGAAKSRGHGLVKLGSATVTEQDLNSRDGILRALRDKRGTEIELPGIQLAERPRVHITITWHPRGPLMVKAENDGVGVDMLPLTSAIDGRLSFVLPGSSIKGAFRSHAERIVRTLCPEIKSEDEFLDQVEVPFIVDLFGAASAGEDDQELNEEGPPVPGLSALGVEDCYAKSVRFSRELWARVEQADSTINKVGQTENELYIALREAGLEGTQMAMHVAVDRWTGGAAEGFLYSVLEPHDIEWEPIRLRLDLARLDGAQKQLGAIACLFLVLRDLAAGRLPLGFGANRGMGALANDAVQIETRAFDDEI
ncbi:MAG: hypothetical protein J2P31_08380, partial [Blastocatellia bacterium]|nr:hypothetical protein [Blastocatellia bacterium]